MAKKIITKEIDNNVLLDSVKSIGTLKPMKEIKISGFVEGGFSGSPVVDDDNNLIGVVANHPQQTKSIFNIISWEHVVKLIDLENS